MRLDGLSDKGNLLRALVQLRRAGLVRSVRQTSEVVWRLSDDGLRLVKEMSARHEVSMIYNEHARRQPRRQKFIVGAALARKLAREISNER
jgi:hypothetical protein